MKNFNVTSMLVMLMFMCITSMQAQSITPSKKYRPCTDICLRNAAWELPALRQR